MFCNLLLLCGRRRLRLSELIWAYQKGADTFRLIPIGSDKFRYPPTNIPRTPNHPFSLPPQRTFSGFSPTKHPQFTPEQPSSYRAFTPFYWRTHPKPIPPPALLLQNHSILSIEQRTFSFTSSSFLRRSHPTFAHLCSYFDASSSSFL